MNTPAYTIANALLQARRIVVFTGAGMSAEAASTPFATAQRATGQKWTRV